MIERLRTTLLLLAGFVVLAAAIALPAAAVAQSQRHFPADEELEVMLRYLVEDDEAPGVVLGILEADGSTRVLSYGDPGPGARALGPRSVFEIGSINKTFTGALLADMVRRGEVALSDPVSKYLPDSVAVPARDGREITLLDLATHQSGLPRLPDNHTPADPGNPYADYTVETMYAFLSGHELRRDPGAEFEYSNLGMGLLGHALARAAGTSFRDLLRERVLEPLGMDMTGYALEGELAAWMVRGHGTDGDVVPFWFGTEAIDGAGGLRSNVLDMLTYLKANVGPPETDLQQAMRDAQEIRETPEEDRGVGLGWQVQRYDGRRIVTHGGGTGGFRTRIAFDPEKGVGTVMLTNSRGFRDDLGIDFVRRGPPLDLPEIDVAREVLGSYAGTYEFGSGPSFHVRLEEEGYLTLQAPENVRFRMYAESDTSFFLKRTPWRFTFTKDDAGEVAEVAADLEGRALTGRKVGAEAPPPEVVAGNAPPKDQVDLPLPAGAVARYQGSYTIEVGSRTLELEVFGEDGRLMVRPGGRSASRLKYQGDHAFIPEVDPDLRLVFRVEDGRATGVTLHQGGASLPGKRKP